MTITGIEEHFLGRPGATSGFPFGPGVRVYKVGGKMFALLSEEEPRRLSLKNEPDQGVLLRATYPAIAPGYHLHKAHWSTITLDGTVPADLITSMIDDSYDLVVASLARTVRAALHAEEELSGVRDFVRLSDRLATAGQPT